MADRKILQFQLEDGRIAEFEVPETPVQTAAPERSLMQQAGLTAYGAGKGATANFLDEMLGYVAPDAAQQLESEYKKFSSERPYLTTGSEIAGGFALPYARSANLAKQAAMGVLSGIGGGTTAQERSIGGLLGGGLGVGAGLIGRGLGRLTGSQAEASQAQKIVGSLSPAEQSLAKQASYQGLDIAEAIRQVRKDSPSASQAVETLAEKIGYDLGPTGKRMTTAAQVTEFAKGRQSERPVRLQKAIESAFPQFSGISGEAAHIQAKEAAIAARQAGTEKVAQLSAPVYNKLDWQLDWTPKKINQIATAMKDAEEQILKQSNSIEATISRIGSGINKVNVADLGQLSKQLEELSPLRGAFGRLEKLRQSDIGKAAFRNVFQGQPGGRPDPLDMTLRDYQKLSSYLKEQTTQSRTQWPTQLQQFDAKEISKLSNAVNDELKTIVTGLAEAHQQYPEMLKIGFGGMKDSTRKVLNAISNYDPTKKGAKTPGEIILNQSPETIKDLIAGTRKIEQGALRKNLAVSVRSTLEEKMATKEGQAMIGELLGKGTKQSDVLKTVIGKKQAQSFIGTLKKEKRMAAQEGKIIGGSDTAKNKAAELLEQTSQALPKDIITKIVSAATTPRQTIAKLLDLGLNQETDPQIARQVLNILLSQGPEATSEMIKLGPVVEQLKGIPNLRQSFGDIGQLVGARAASPIVGRIQNKEQTNK